MTNSRSHTHELHPASGKALVILLALNLVSLTQYVPWWVSAVSAVLLVWRWESDRRGFSPPAFWQKAALSISLCALVFWEHKSFFGYEVATCLLVILSCFKLLETTKLRDVHVIVMVSWLLAGCLQLFNQSLFSLISGVLLILGGAMVLRLLNEPQQAGWRVAANVKRILKLFVLGLPIGLLVFVVFPRMSIHSFGIQLRPPEQTGFSDELDPGSVEEVAQTDVPVMRVKFVDSKPNYFNLYWRGAILDESEGLRWRRREKASFQDSFEIPNEGVVDQLITLEPQTGPWMFGLDFPVRVEWVTTQFRNPIGLDRDQLVRSARNTNSRAVYRVKSLLQPESRKYLHPHDQQRFTRVRGSQHFPKTVALAKEFASKYSNPEVLVDQLMAYFQFGGFTYTMKPGTLPEEKPLDAFLFQSKKGFCEHYAGAFATLARLAGVPARVVVGFQGAEYNEVGKFLVVKTRDAHSWTEVFIPGKGWMRVDPVRVIAPERIEIGAKAFFEKTQQIASEWGGFLTGVARSTWVAQTWLRMVSMTEAMDYRVTQFLLEFSLDQQLEILSIFGLGDEKRLALALATLGILGLAIAGFRIMKEREDRPRDVMSELYSRAKLKLETLGCSVSEHMGPRTLCCLVHEKKVERPEAWLEWLEDWEKWRYGSHAPSRQKVRDLRRRLLKLESYVSRIFLSAADS